MKFLGFRKEKSIQKKGYNFVAGIDEVGRGALAGPVCASAVFIKDFRDIKGFLRNINDSKKVSAEKRKELFSLITKSKSIEWGIGTSSNKIIDKINILEATKAAMRRALFSLNNKLKGEKIDYLILDGNFEIDAGILEEPVIKGDEKIFSCAAASILAKVYRDKIMVKFSRRYLNYGFDRNKGYGTDFHIRQIKKYGFSKIHRESFKISK